MAGNKRFWSFSLLASLCVWLSLAWLVWSADPDVWVNRAIFLVLLFLGLLTLLSPLAHYLHFRFTAANSYRSDAKRSLREGGLAAAFFTLCAWLQMGEALNWINALLLLSALALIEVFILLKSS